MNTISKNKNIKLRQLGQTDIHISPIGLGCWQFSEGKGGAGRNMGSSFRRGNRWQLCKRY